MSVVGLAQAPLPPGNVTFDTVDFPTTFANTSPITVAWARRLRTKATISFQEDADETPDITTTYYVRHGPPFSFRTEVSLGTGTSGTFNFDYKGLNLVEVYAKAGGFTSSILSFYTQVTNGTNTAAGGPIGTIIDTAPGIDVAVIFGGPIGTIGVGPSIIPHVSGDFGSALVLSGPGGSVSIPLGGSIPQVSVLPPQGHVPIAAAASGSIPSMTLSSPEGMDEIDGDADGALGTLEITAPAGSAFILASGGLGSGITVSPVSGVAGVLAAASGSIGTITISEPDGVATITGVPLAIVQATTNGANSTDGGAATVHFPSAPVSGNWLIVAAMLYTGNGPPDASTGWTLDDSAEDATGTEMYIATFYKLAGASEPQNPQITVAGRDYWALSAWEVSGGTGVWATDHIRTTLNPSLTSYPGTYPATAGPITTLNNAELILFAATGNSSPAATFSMSPGTQDSTISTGGGISPCNALAGHFTEASSGTSISTTLSSTHNSSAEIAWIELQSS